MTVIAIMATLAALISPAIQSLSGAGSLTKNTSDLVSLLEQARAYAMGNNTYVYVGLLETSSPQGQSNGVGRVVVAIVASRDGTRPYQNSPALIGASGLVAVSRLIYLDNLHLANASVLSNSGGMSRPSTANNTGFVDLSSSSLSTTVSFQWPLGGTSIYTFGGTGGSSVSDVIEIDPQGVARIQTGNVYSSTIPSYIEIGLLPTHGGTVGATGSNQAAVQVDGITGAVSAYRP